MTEVCVPNEPSTPTQSQPELGQSITVSLPIEHNIEVKTANAINGKNIYVFSWPAVIDTKGIDNILLKTSGFGYNDSIKFTNLGNAKAVAKIFNGRVVDIIVVNKGSGFTNNFEIVTESTNFNQPVRAIAIVENGRISDIQIINSGSGYSEQPTIKIIGGGGIQAQALAVVENREISEIIITDSGTGYTAYPEITIEGGGGQGASANVNNLDFVGKSNGVSSIEIINPGSQFSSQRPPNVRIIGGGGVGAEARAIVDSHGQISKIDITSPGEGYTSKPVIEIDRGLYSIDGGSLEGIYQGSEATAISGPLKPVLNNIDFNSETLVTEIQNYVLDGLSDNIKFSPDGKTAYAVNESAGLHIIDVSNPSKLTTINTINSTDETLHNNSLFFGKALTVNFSPDGTKAYIGTTTGFTIVDIRDPLNPTRTHRYSTSKPVVSMVVSSDGNTVYAGTDHVNSEDKNSLYIIDTSNNSMSTSIFPLNSSSMAGTAALATTTIVGNKVISVDISQNGSGYDPSTTIPVQFSPSPKITAKGYATSDIHGRITHVTIEDPGDGYPTAPSITFGHSVPVDIALSAGNTTAYIADSTGDLRILDVSNKLEPAILATVNIEGTAVDTVVSSDGTRAYVADRNKGLQIIDISNNLEPSIIKTVPTTGTTVAIALSSDGNTIYAADITGLQIIDVSNPQTASIIDTLKTKGSDDIIQVALSPNQRYVYATTPKGFTIFDLNSPKFSASTCTYNFVNIPESHPIAFYGNSVDAVAYTGDSDKVKTKIGSSGRQQTYYHGNVQLTVNKPETLSYECYNHGYMGGQNNIAYEPKACECAPPTSISCPDGNTATLAHNALTDCIHYTCVPNQSFNCHITSCGPCFDLNETLCACEEKPTTACTRCVDGIISDIVYSPSEKFIII